MTTEESHYVRYGEFVLQPSGPVADKYDPLELRLPRGNTTNIHSIDHEDALRLAVAILDGLEEQGAPTAPDPLKSGVENLVEVLAEGLHRINSSPEGQAWADADINFKTYLRGMALPLALAAHRSLAPSAEATEAAARVTEYLRQFEKQTSVDVTVINSVWTDIETGPAELRPADLKHLLKAVQRG